MQLKNWQHNLLLCLRRKIMADQNLIDVLYEELVHLDEQAGCFDEETNAALDAQRWKLYKQIQELEATQ